MYSNWAENRLLGIIKMQLILMEIIHQDACKGDWGGLIYYLQKGFLILKY